MLGWSISVAILVAAAIVLVYITLGGLTSAIYNEVLQFFIIVASLLPLTLVALHDVGGWSGLQDKVKGSALKEGGLHAWQGLGRRQRHQPDRRQLDRRSSSASASCCRFGYWTTNFAEVQRALSAKNMSAARRTPLIGAYPKIFIPALTIIPGLVALVTVKGLGGSSAGPAVQQRDPAADRALPARGHARPRGDRPARRVHGRRGGERDVVQHGRHLRPLAGLRRARTATRSTTCAWGGS